MTQICLIRFGPLDRDPSSTRARKAHHQHPPTIPSIPDLLVAATAELADLTLLHLDKDFEIIAELARITTERLTVN